MTPLDYEYLRKILKERSGLDLPVDKQYLVESRLVPLARKAGLPGIGDLVQKMKNGAESLVADVVEAMTTNETFFFRDKVPFDHLRETMIPALLQARAGRHSLRIWCAAGSTGQEPYSIAMTLADADAKPRKALFALKAADTILAELDALVGDQPAKSPAARTDCSASARPPLSTKVQSGKSRFNCRTTS